MTARRTGALIAVLLISTATWLRCSSGTAPATVAVTGPRLIAAGDIGDCAFDGDEKTAAMLDTLTGTIAALGDEAYEIGTISVYNSCFAPSWGRHKARIHPVPGNHDLAANNTDYYTYFGSAAGTPQQGYYSYDVGEWHIIALNIADKSAEIAANGPQLTWLKADLAASSKKCTLAYWHVPRFSSGIHGDSAALAPVWDILYAANVDVALVGHDHLYERFAPQTSAGVRDNAKGIREFVVGTGGSGLYPFGTIRANSEFRENTQWGLLLLTLGSSAYHWDFASVDGKILDSGDGGCH